MTRFLKISCFLGVFAALGAVACDEDVLPDTSGSVDPETKDASVSADANASADSGNDDGDTTCKGVTATGNVVALISVVDADPVPSGGTIVDGTYQLTSATAYNGPSATAFVRLKATLQISGSRWQRGYSWSTATPGRDAGSEGGANVGSESGTFSTDGTALATTTTCSDGSRDTGFSSFTGGFTASGSTLTLIQDAPSSIQGATKIAYVFEKQ